MEGPGYAAILLMILLEVNTIYATGIAGRKRYLGGICSADKYGTFRLAIQFCDGNNWLTLQSGGKSDPLSLGKSCLDIMEKGLSHGDGEYLIDPDGSGQDRPFKVLCDMSSFGGGWTLCYTTDNHVDLKKELSTKPSTGYRANCNNVPFTEVMFLDEKSKEKVAFRKAGSTITFTGNYNKKANAFGLWTAQGVASTQYKYQLLVCDTSYYKGFHVSGYTNCYKACGNWCGDTSTPYFRTAAVSDKTRGGVAFNENGHKPLPNRLITAGIR